MADLDLETARLDAPAVAFHVPESQVPLLEVERDLGCLAGREPDDGETLQLARGTRHRRLQIRDVDLDDFLAGAQTRSCAAVTRSSSGSPSARPSAAMDQRLVLERRVAEAVPEGESRLDAGGVEAAVADVDALA